MGVRNGGDLATVSCRGYCGSNGALHSPTNVELDSAGRCFTFGGVLAISTPADEGCACVISVRNICQGSSGVPFMRKSRRFLPAKWPQVP